MLRIDLTPLSAVKQIKISKEVRAGGRWHRRCEINCDIRTSLITDQFNRGDGMDYDVIAKWHTN